MAALVLLSIVPLVVAHHPSKIKFVEAILVEDAGGDVELIFDAVWPPAPIPSYLPSRDAVDLRVVQARLLNGTLECEARLHSFKDVGGPDPTLAVFLIDFQFYDEEQTRFYSLMAFYVEGSWTFQGWVFNRTARHSDKFDVKGSVDVSSSTVRVRAETSAMGFGPGEAIVFNTGSTQSVDASYKFGGGVVQQHDHAWADDELALRVPPADANKTAATAAPDAASPGKADTKGSARANDAKGVPSASAAGAVTILALAAYAWGSRKPAAGSESDQGRRARRP